MKSVDANPVRLVQETERRSLQRPTHVQPSTVPSPAALPPLEREPATITRLSVAARMVTEPRALPRSESRVRREFVASLRQEIARGTFGGATDVERTITALLEEI